VAAPERNARRSVPIPAKPNFDIIGSPGRHWAASKSSPAARPPPVIRCDVLDPRDTDRPARRI
jgi:hypothetical protein